MARTACPGRSLWLANAATQRRLHEQVILTLALAIGMNTGVFSVTEAVVLRPLPYPDANRLIFLSSYSTDELTEHDILVSGIDYSNWKDQSRTIESTAAYGNQDLAIMYPGQPTQERVASVSG